MLCCCLSTSLREQRIFNKKKLNLEKEVSIAEIVRQLRVLTAAAQSKITQPEWHSLRLTHSLKSYQAGSSDSESEQKEVKLRKNHSLQRSLNTSKSQVIELIGSSLTVENN